MSYWFWLFIGLILLGQILDICKHLPVRYRCLDLAKPLTFRERFDDVLRPWWTIPLMFTFAFAIVFAIAWLYGTVADSPRYWLNFFSWFRPFGMVMFVNITLRHIQERLDETWKETFSFKQTVTSMLVAQRATARGQAAQPDTALLASRE